MRRSERFTYVQVIAMFLLVLTLASIDSLTLDLFFVTSFVVFLMLSELTSLSTVTPPWRARLWWFVLVGLLGIGYLVVHRVLVVLP